MTVTIHTCRGNFKSAWVAEGGYEPVVEAMFSTDVDGYFMEFDSARAGGFEPLRYPAASGKKVVLGLVTTKVGELEEQGRLEAPHRRGGEVRAAREPVPVAAVRLLQHAPRQRADRRTSSGASSSAWSRSRTKFGPEPGQADFASARVSLISTLASAAACFVSGASARVNMPTVSCGCCSFSGITCSDPRASGSVSDRRDSSDNMLVRATTETTRLCDSHCITCRGNGRPAAAKRRLSGLLGNSLFHSTAHSA